MPTRHNHLVMTLLGMPNLVIADECLEDFTVASRSFACKHGGPCPNVRPVMPIPQMLQIESPWEYAH